MDKTIIWELSLIIFDKSLTGKKPPEDITVRAKFNESKDLKEKIFNIMKIINVRNEYNKKILIVCFKISELLKDMKFVRVFLKFSS